MLQGWFCQCKQDYSLSSFKQKLSYGNQEKSKFQEIVIKNSLLKGKCSVKKFAIIILAPSLFLCKSRTTIVMTNSIIWKSIRKDSICFMQSSYAHPCTCHAQMSWTTPILPSFKKIMMSFLSEVYNNKTTWTNEQRCYETSVFGTCPLNSFMCSISSGLRNVPCMHRSAPAQKTVLICRNCAKGMALLLY